MLVFTVLFIAYAGFAGPLGTEVNDDPQAVTFQSEQVAYLYAHYGIERLTPIDTLFAGDEHASLRLLYPAPSGVPGALVVQVGRDHHVQHVGLHLFTREESAAFNPISGFLERYLLTVYAQGASPEMNLSLLVSKQILIQINGYALGSFDEVSNDVRVVLPYLSGERSCSLSWSTYTYTLACETQEGDQLSIQVPAWAELILGQDKQELQAAMGAQMQQQMQLRVQQHPLAGEEEAACSVMPAFTSLVSHRRGMLRTEGRTLYPGIRSDRYYQHVGWKKELHLVRDPSDWLEYLNNLFLCPPAELAAQLEIDHKVYGATSDPFDMPLNQLMAFFEREAFESYVGFERDEQGGIVGTAVFKHPAFNYNHLLVIHGLDRLLLSEQEGLVLEAELYTFIRSDNVRFLFGDYVDRRGQKIPVAIN